ncbi:CaiF/GrlA family transcriptional regulator, partial [Salmonella enterica subsp. enterica serovar Newport]|nr:CaiF/GrlA family transcriptional regulator [Salmonella enterica subsp. enterica serovar Newport]
NDKATYRSRQSNHESCFLPECVRCYSAEPLYIIIARWCLIQRGWVNRNTISRMFRITGRRASFLMSYIHSRSDCVDCNIRKTPIAGRVFRFEICVRNVSNPVRKTDPAATKVNHQATVCKSKPLSDQGKILFNEIMHQLRTRSLSQSGESDESDS